MRKESDAPWLWGLCILAFFLPLGWLASQFRHVMSSPFRRLQTGRGVVQTQRSGADSVNIQTAGDLRIIGDRILAENREGQRLLREPIHHPLSEWWDRLRTAWGFLPFYTVNWAELAARHADLPEPLSESNLEAWGDAIAKLRESWDERDLRPPSVG
jgi:hypothetical protein